MPDYFRRVPIEHLSSKQIEEIKKSGDTPMMKKYFIAHFPKIEPWIIKSDFNPRYNTEEKKWESFEFTFIMKKDGEFNLKDMIEFQEEILSMKDFYTKLEILDSTFYPTEEQFEFRDCNIDYLSFENFSFETNLVDVSCVLHFKRCMITMKV